MTPASRLPAAQKSFGRRWFGRATRRGLHPNISTATASRDLRDGTACGLIESRGERRLTEYQVPPTVVALTRARPAREPPTVEGLDEVMLGPSIRWTRHAYVTLGEHPLRNRSSTPHGSVRLSQPLVTYAAMFWRSSITT